MNTYDDLYERAKELGIQGRTDMTKSELTRAVAEREEAEGQPSEVDQLRHRVRELEDAIRYHRERIYHEPRVGDGGPIDYKLWALLENDD